MKHAILIVPDWIGGPGEESLLRENMPALNSLAERGRVVRLALPPPASVPEAAFLGLDPSRVDMAQGPLTVAALGFDPPERSVHFHLSLMSVGVTLEQSQFKVPSEDLRTIVEAARRLDTRVLTFVLGDDRDHGLVWEDGSIDLGTVSPVDAEGKAVGEVLPEGDGEPMLRRYIDDSVNLLSGLELNRRRQGEGLPPFNVLWPWGQGLRTSVPNLALRYGQPIHVESPLTRLKGLARLAGCRHGDPAAMGTGTNLRLERVLETIEKHSVVVAVLPAFAEMRAMARMEEAQWLSREIDTRLLVPLETRLREEPMRILIASPGPHGLALQVGSGPADTGSTPFDERALEGRGVPTYGLAELVATELVS